MKKLIFLISIMLCFIGLQAQQLREVVKGSKTYTYNGAATKGDTVIKSQTKEYLYISSTLANTFQSTVTVANVSGTTTARLYVYQSFDNVNYYYVDSSASLSAAGTALTAKCTVFAPYIKLKVKGITNVQKTTITKVVTAIKNEQ